MNKMPSACLHSEICQIMDGCKQWVNEGSSPLLGYAGASSTAQGWPHITQCDRRFREGAGLIVQQRNWIYSNLRVDSCTRSVRGLWRKQWPWTQQTFTTDIYCIYLFIYQFTGAAWYLRAYNTAAEHFLHPNWTTPSCVAGPPTQSWSQGYWQLHIAHWNQWDVHLKQIWAGP